MYTRKKFLETITSATLGSIGTGMLLPGTADARLSDEKNQFSTIPDGAVILFQGDSITDAGRNKKTMEPNVPWALGGGYVLLVSAHLRDKMAGKDLKCYNRGISGNKVFQLAERWEKDCLQLQPDVLSILVGVNDFWHTFDLNYNGTIEIYERDYRALLQRTRKTLSDVKLIIGEPFAVKEGSAVNENWFPAFEAYREAAKRIAKDFDAAFIPYQAIFDKAAEKVSPTYWTGDGVHPTLAGSHLMAHAWLETIKRI